jgi:hypothetical protein
MGYSDLLWVKMGWGVTGFGPVCPGSNPGQAASHGNRMSTGPTWDRGSVK